MIGIIGCKSKPTELPVVETKISGKVTDKSSSTALSGATITTNPVSSSVTTDNAGTFTISGVTAGQYLVSAAKNGYKAATVSVSVTEGSTAPADIQLEVIKPDLSVSVPFIDLGTAQTAASFILSNATSVGTITYSITKTADWLTLSGTSGTITNNSVNIGVSATRTNLGYGNYSTTISIISNGGNKDISVTMTVQNPNAPQLSVSPVTLEFGSSLSQNSFSIRNTGTSKLDWSVSTAQGWIALSPMQDSTRTETDQVTVTVNRTGMSPADYAGEIGVSSNAGSQKISVKMTVPTTPSLVVSTNSLDFDSTKTQLTFNVSNGGSGTLNWNTSSSQPWLTTLPQSGTNSGTVAVTVNKNSLSYGKYTGFISLSSTGGSGTVNVKMAVTPPPPPTAVTISVGAVSTSSITINWTASSVSDFASYKVYYSTTSDVSENSTLAATVTNKGFLATTVFGLNNNTVYYFRVFVVNQTQQSTGSNILTQKTERVFPTWQQVALPASFQVQSVHFISENNIWVAGSNVISGYGFPGIYQFNGTAWVASPVQSQDTTDKFCAITFRNNIEGWAATEKSRIYKYDGTSWKIVKYLPTTTASPKRYRIYDAVATVNDVWFYGDYLTNSGQFSLMYRWDGVTFTEIPIGNGYSWEISDLTFSNSTLGFAVTDGGYAFMYNGIGWTELGNFGYTGYTISGINANNVWAAVDAYLYNYDGTKWNRYNDIGGYGIRFFIRQLRIISSTEGWGISNDGSTYYYDGKAWSKLTQKLSGELVGMKDFGNGNLWGLITGTPNKLMRLK